LIQFGGWRQRVHLLMVSGGICRLRIGVEIYLIDKGVTIDAVSKCLGRPSHLGIIG